MRLMILKTLVLSSIILLLYVLLGSKYGFNFIENKNTIDIIIAFLVVEGIAITIFGFNEIVQFYHKHLALLNTIGVILVVVICSISAVIMYQDNGDITDDFIITLPSIGLTVSAAILIIMLFVNFILLNKQGDEPI